MNIRVSDGGIQAVKVGGEEVRRKGVTVAAVRESIGVCRRGLGAGRERGVGVSVGIGVEAVGIVIRVSVIRVYVIRVFVIRV